MTLARTFISAFSGLLLAVQATPSVAGQTWDMALAYAASNYHSQNAARFAEIVKEKSGGKLEIKTHPSGSLYNGNEIFRAVRTNQIAIGERFISALGNENAVFEVDAIPFLATSFNQARKLYEASKASTEEVLNGMGVKLLYAVPWPPQGLYSTKPVESASDMKGMRFRATNQMTTRLAELMGAQPTKIEAADMANAFATGVVNSMITSGATGVDRKMWEYISVFTDVQAFIPKNMVVVNQAAWSKLDADTQQVVLDAARTVEEAGWAKAMELADSAKKTLAENGMKVVTPSAVLQNDLSGLGKTLADEWLKRAGASGQAILDKYKSSM